MTIAVHRNLPSSMRLPTALRPEAGRDAGDLSSRAQAVVFAYEQGLARPGR